MADENPFLRYDESTGGLTLGLSDADVGQVSQEIESTFETYDTILKQRDLTPDEQADLERAILAKEQLLEAISKDSRVQGCFGRDTTGKSWTFKDTPECIAFYHTTLAAETRELLNKTRNLPDACGKSTLSGINTHLLIFFEKLKRIKKYGEWFINGALNKLTKIRDLIANTSDLIAGILKILVQRIRSWLLNLIRKLIDKVMNKIFPTLAAMIKDTIVDEIVKAILCKFDDIIKGLSKLVSDFLFAMLQNVINPVFCAAEQFTNALLNNLTAQIDRALQPILKAINDIIGGVAKVAGSVFQALDFILGFESFLCQKPNCPEIKKFKASAWGSPSKSQQDRFDKFLSVPDSGQILDSATGWTKDLKIFGVGTEGDYALECNTNPYRCGPPKIEIFGGGGIGAVADAVVNTIGEVIGANLKFGGSGYTSPPFVTFYDSCEKGSNASGYTEINDNGEVIRIIIVNPGNGYSNTPENYDEFGNAIVPGSNINPGSGGGTSGTGGTGGGGTGGGTGGGGAGITTSYGGNPIPPMQEEVVVKNYVACLEEVQIISTGIGYKPNDTVTITPNIPNLQAIIKLTEEGQIIQIQILNNSCGLNEIPEISINSATGVGAIFRPILNIKRVEEFDSNAAYDPKKLVTVVDCPGR
jgi:hypothetical protein